MAVLWCVVLVLSVTFVVVFVIVAVIDVIVFVDVVVRVSAISTCFRASNSECIDTCRCGGECVRDLKKVAIQHVKSVLLFSILDPTMKVTPV